MLYQLSYTPVPEEGRSLAMPPGERKSLVMSGGSEEEAGIPRARD